MERNRNYPIPSRVLSFLLALVMVAGLAPLQTPVSAVEPETAPAQPASVEQTGDSYWLTNDYFRVEIGQYGQIRTIQLVNDGQFTTNYVINEDILPRLGSAPVHYWMGELMLTLGSADNLAAYTTGTSNNRTITLEGETVAVTYVEEGFTIRETYTLDGDQLVWSTTLENTGDTALTVADWGMPMPFNEALDGSAEEIYEDHVIDHSFVGLDSSYIYALRPSGEGKFLLFTPDVSTGAKLEYCDTWSDDHKTGTDQEWASGGSGWVSGLSVFYIHSDQIKKTNSGYLPNTALTLDAKESQTYTFRFSSVEDEADMRSTLYQNDIIDMVAVPGFAYSVNMPGKIYLHTEVPQEDIQVSFRFGVYPARRQPPVWP